MIQFRKKSLQTESAGPVECGVCVAGLLLNLLQPGALELRAPVAATEAGPGLGGVIVIQLGKK